VKVACTVLRRGEDCEIFPLSDKIAEKNNDILSVENINNGAMFTLESHLQIQSHKVADIFK
jgi:hypothetical protein